jgi:hypothetical protein
MRWFRRERRAHDDGKALPVYNLGDILVGNNVVTRAQIAEAVRFKLLNDDLFIGEALVCLGIIDRDALRTALLEQKALRSGGDRHVISLAREAARRASLPGIRAATLQLSEKLK